MSKCYIGVDPGAKGFICAQYEGKFEFFPISDLDLNELNSVFVYLSQKYEKLVCVMEQIHALFGSSIYSRNSAAVFQKDKSISHPAALSLVLNRSLKNLFLQYP